MSQSNQAILQNDINDIDYLLDRAYNSFTLDKGRIKPPPPIFEKKDKKSYIHNFIDICKAIHQEPEDVKRFLSRELRMEMSFKENGSLKIDSTATTVVAIEDHIVNYIREYVMCKSCKSCKTEQQRIDRITYLICNACKSKRAFTKNF
jgi:translation initiation factor 2 subunit 2